MRLAMENTLLLMAPLVLLTVGAADQLPSGVDRRMYCETCIATVQELKEAIKVLSGEISRAKIKAAMDKVCERLTFEEKSLAQARAACKHLLDLYDEKFEEVFLTEKEDTLAAHLCYIYTKACIGVKRKAFQEQKHKFEDEVIEDFIKKHGDRVSRSKPTITVVDSESLKNTKDEF